MTFHTFSWHMKKYVCLCMAWGNEESPIGHPIDHVLF
jgi:hypothetical protein